MLRLGFQRQFQRHSTQEPSNIMAKGSRILCVSLPLIGTIAILACMAYISSAGIRVDGKEIDSKYFALIDTSKITTTIGKETYHGLPDSHDHSKQKDVFAIYLWNYCSGTKLKGEFRANYCSGARTPFDQYRLWNTWKIDITKGELEHEGPKKDANKRIEVGVEGITYTPKTIRAVYSAAIAVVVLELIFGFVAIWTRWASFVTAILSFVSLCPLSNHVLNANDASDCNSNSHHRDCLLPGPLLRSRRQHPQARLLLIQPRQARCLLRQVGICHLLARRRHFCCNNSLLGLLHLLRFDIREEEEWKPKLAGSKVERLERRTQIRENEGWRERWELYGDAGDTLAELCSVCLQGERTGLREL